MTSPSSFSISRKLATLASLTTPWIASSHAAAAPWPITFSPNETVGPDGPWNVITFDIDFPDQTQWLLPSLLQTSVIVNATVCRSQRSDCQTSPSAAGMWSGSAAQSLREDMNSAPYSPGAWTDEAGTYTTSVMGLEGSLRYVSDRFTLKKESGGGSAILNRIGTAVADNVTVTYPGGGSYTMDVGFLSLYGGGATFNWTAADGETAVSQNLTLPFAHSDGVIPSVSYGLHVGSAAHDVPGSLYWGGYDQARVIGEPVAARSSADENGGGFFSLVDVSLGVASGGSALLNTTSSTTLPLTGLLDISSGGGGSTANSLTARADPGVPYLYLPGATCAAIAAHLPLSYAAEYGLYLWDTAAASYERLVTSPHHLSFTFASSTSSNTSNTTIAVPLALLNLTLSSRITNTAGGKTYFPCRPYTAVESSSTSTQQPEAILGRAFLQAAFLAQNWQSGTTWLAQAPGPAGASGDGVAGEEAVVKEIAEGDTELARLGEAPASWADTWTGVLSALDEDGSSSGTTTTDATGGLDGGGEEEEEESLSTGAKAGVGVGAAVVVVGVVLGTKRKRRADDAAEMGPGQQQRQPLWGMDGGELGGREVVEMGGDPRKEARELESYRGVSELDAGPQVAEKSV